MSNVVFDNIPCPCIFRELNRNLTAQLFLNFKDCWSHTVWCWVLPFMSFTANHRLFAILVISLGHWYPMPISLSADFCVHPIYNYILIGLLTHCDRFCQAMSNSANTPITIKLEVEELFESTKGTKGDVSPLKPLTKGSSRRRKTSGLKHVRCDNLYFRSSGRFTWRELSLKTAR